MTPQCGDKQGYSRPCPGCKVFSCIKNGWWNNSPKIILFSILLICLKANCSTLIEVIPNDRSFLIAFTMWKHNELEKINKLYHFVLMEFVHLPALLFVTKWVFLREEGDFWNLISITIVINLVGRHLEYVSILRVIFHIVALVCTS